MPTILNAFVSPAGDDALPGNLGLMDQVMALQWIKENIAGKIPDEKHSLKLQIIYCQWMLGAS